MAPEFDKIGRKQIQCYDGRSVDVFALGITLLNLVLNINVLDTDASNDKIYRHVIRKNYKLFWASLDKEIKYYKSTLKIPLSEEFKTLIIQMIHPDSN